MQTTYPEDTFRHTTEYRGDSLTITITPRWWLETTFALFIAPFWLVVTGMIVYSYLLSLIDGSYMATIDRFLQSPAESLFLAIFFGPIEILTMFAVMAYGGWYTYLLLWQLGGREIITVNEQTLMVRKQLFGVGRSQVYQARHIRRLRVARHIIHTAQNNTQIRCDPLVFDYGASTIRLGLHQGKAENRHIAQAIQKHFPRYTTAGRRLAGRNQRDRQEHIAGALRPPQPRYTLHAHGDSFTVSIPARKNWVVIAGLVALLYFCAGVELTILYFMWHLGMPIAIALLPLCILIPLGFSSISSILWQLFGKEIITVTPRAITAQKRLPGFSRTKTYPAGQIGDLRVLQYAGNALWRPLPFRYPITFYHRGRPVRIAYETTQAENHRLLKLITGRFPQYGGPVN